VNAVPDPKTALPRVKLYADRQKVYTKDVYGPVRSAKSAILVACLAVYYTLPWLRWDRGPGVPNQALLLDIWHERFYLFNVVLWPQDIYLLTFALILGAVALFLVTSLFGRLWCGFTCPQTVWTDLFMMVERWIEGDRNTRMKRDAGPWVWDKIWRKALTHYIWIGIAFWTGGAWVMYYVDAPTVVVEFWTGRASPEVYAMTALFTATTYLLAGWAREQVCTYMCPWPRFQSAMLDEQSMIITYEAHRGEPRGHGKRTGNEQLGECIDCNACVHVCPTGVDIRNGLQLSCIGCGLCIDACNHVMEKTDQEPWLITWDTLTRQRARAEGRREKLHLIRPRTMIYVTALLLAIGAVAWGISNRSTTTLSLIHDRAPLYIRLRDGGIRNVYTVKLANKTQQAASYTLAVSGLQSGKLSLPDAPAPADSVSFTVVPSQVGNFRLTVQGAPDDAAGGSQNIYFTLKNNNTGEELRYRALFLSPAPEKD
jgi:cytochrome c oxidase accessory protein FixG